MFEGKTEQQAKEEILESVKLYTEKYHNQKKRGGGYRKDNVFHMRLVYMTVQKW